MSNLLKEAIVDAKALRATALKNAESAIVEKYSEEIRKTVEQILEQEPPLPADPAGAPLPDMGAEPADMGLEPDLGMEMGEEPAEETVEDEEDAVPFAATDGLSDEEGENLHNLEDEGESVEVTIDLGALKEAVAALGDNVDEEFEFSNQELTDLLSEDDEEGEDEDESKGYAAETDPSGAKVEAETEEFGSKMSPNLEEDLEEAFGRAKSQRTGSPKGHAKKKCQDKDGERVDCDSPGAEPMEEAKGEKKPDGDGDGVPPWADKDDNDPDIQEEELDLDSLTDAIVEKLTVDMGAELSGWAGRPSSQVKHEMEMELAHRRSTDVEEDLKDLKKAQEELVFENNQLQEQNTQYKQAVNELRENLQDVNLSNARLLYTNRILRNTSLNERQKNKIVEAISSSGSVMEAKTIYETLQSTVEAAPKKSPQSLSEAINRRSSVIHASRQEKQTTDLFSERMKRLAGIGIKQ